MKKLFVIILALILCLLPVFCFAQIWEGDGGDAIQEGLGFGSGSGGGWIPEPLDPAMTHYTISFKDDNQTTSLFSPIELNENTVVDLSVFVPTRSEGYDFDHWEDGNGNTVTEVTMTSDQTVYATWSVHYHSITWQITDYSQDPVATYTSVDSHIAYGSVIVASSTPTVPSGYGFSGWDNPATMPDYDLVVNGSITKLSIVFKIREYFSSSDMARYPIIYEGNIANYSPISYSNGVVSMGDWGDWINEHFTPVMLRSDGTVDYELSRTNQNYKADGVTPSDVGNTSYDGNAMLKIKKFYLYCTTEYDSDYSCNVHTIRISDTKVDNNYTCWGFVDANGVEQDYVYYGLYSGYVDSNSKLRSLSGIILSNALNGNHLKSYTNMVTAAKANGNGWNISNLPLENAIGLVLMMIYKDTNPMFVAQEVGSDPTNPYRQDLSVCQTTGTRNADGGFPYTTELQQSKALWIENYWRDYDSSGQAATWVNGLGSLQNPNASAKQTDGAYFSYYRLKEPYDFTNVASWTYMNNTTTYAYQSNAHYLTDLTIYDNILFSKSDGVQRAAVTTYELNSRIGGAQIIGSYKDQHLTDTILPAKMGGRPMADQYTDPPHAFSYQMFGKDTGQSKAYGAGRLTYLPQSN